ncbi:hypothetical protein D3H35_27390 [Cohnella faecalis]|uniref:Uncharacterized protein n=1 Tax=Cohnella faecalis TaxID=2315694 RepID=A0A398CE26_9BACL|nr:hypothetical protein D3H35_27390 [Cohnella faecalis]
MRAYGIGHPTVSPSATNKNFADEADIASWALEGVKAAAALGFVQGAERIASLRTGLQRAPKPRNSF